MTLVIAGPAGATSVPGLQFLRPPVLGSKVVRRILQPRSVPLPAAARPVLTHLGPATSILPSFLKGSEVGCWFDRGLSSSRHGHGLTDVQRGLGFIPRVCCTDISRSFSSF